MLILLQEIHHWIVQKIASDFTIDLRLELTGLLFPLLLEIVSIFFWDLDGARVGVETLSNFDRLDPAELAELGLGLEVGFSKIFEEDVDRLFELEDLGVFGLEVLFEKFDFLLELGN